MLKVLVVDDDSPIRRWLEYCIGQLEGFVLAGSAASGTQGLEPVSYTHLDVYKRQLSVPPAAARPPSSTA